MKGDTIGEPEGVFGSKNKIFDAWYNGETKYDFTSKVTSDLTLVTKYVDFTEEAWQGAIDALCVYDPNKNFTLKYQYFLNGENANNYIYKIDKNFLEQKTVDSSFYEYEYEDGINVYSLDKNNGSIKGCEIHKFANKYDINATSLYNYCITIKIGFYDVFNDFVYDKDNNTYTAEKKVEAADKFYKGVCSFCVVDGKIRLKDLDVYEKDKEEDEYKKNCTHNYYDFNKTKLDKELNPTNGLILNGSKGKLTGKLDAKVSNVYFASFNVPDDIDTTKPFKFCVKNGDTKIDIIDKRFNGFEIYSIKGQPDIGFSRAISVDASSTASEKYVKFDNPIPQSSPVRFALDCVLKGESGQTYKNAEFVVEYTVKK